MKRLLKWSVIAISLLFVLPLALLSGFGRIPVLFQTGSQCIAQVPGIVGDYLRGAFYRMTLRACSPWCRISFGVLFSSSDAVIEDDVYIGPYTVLGRVRIGHGTQIASHVQVLSGAHQHSRDAAGNVSSSYQGVFRHVTIGAGCWIGAGAIVMTNIGERTTIGAGAVVTKEIPADVVAVGNPARVLTSRPSDSEPQA